MGGLRFFVEENAEGAHRTNTSDEEKEVHEGPIAGLLEECVVKQPARMGHSVGRIEVLGENMLNRIQFLLIEWIQRRQELDHMILVGLGEAFFKCGHQRKANTAADVANQVLETDGIADLHVGKISDRERGQGHEESTGTKAREDICENDVAHGHLQGQTAQNETGNGRDRKSHPREQARIHLADERANKNQRG